MGLMTAILVPLGDEFISRNELKAAARILTSDIRYGENKALVEERDYKIRFFPSSNEYRMYFDSGSGRKFKSIKFSKRLDLRKTNFNDDTLWFNRKGKVYQGGTITLKDNYNNWIYVKVTPVTGRVKIDYQP